MKFKRLPSPFPEFRMWGALVEGTSYVVVDEGGHWSASVKRGQFGRTQILGPYPTRKEAEARLLQVAREGLN